MIFPVENKGIFFRKSADRFRIMRSCEELAPGLESFAKGCHKMPNLGQRQVIIWLIPKTDQRSISIVRRNDRRANHKAFLAIREVCERNGDASLAVRELHLKTSRVF